MNTVSLKILTTDEISDIYSTYMVRDFPPSELKPLEHIITATQNGLCHNIGIYDGNLLVGYSIYIIPADAEYGLLDYLAMTGEHRGKGYGHKYFEKIGGFLQDNFPNLKGFFLESEDILSAENDNDRLIRTKRIEFYKNCGCLMTNLGSKLFGVQYSILLYKFNNTSRDTVSGSDKILPDNALSDGGILNTDRQALDYIYKKMFKPHHYKERVSLWARLDANTLSVSAKKLAPYLIGKVLCRRTGDEVLKYKITETECYCGEEDTACHAHKGKTERTKVLYEKGGTAYVYLCYGIHCLFNVVSGEENHPEAVLIRGVEGYNGPGKLTKAMGIDMSLNETDMTKSNILWLEDHGYSGKYVRDKRVGIDYATPKYRDILWRYIAK